MGWKDLKDYTKLDQNNLSKFPESFSELLISSRKGHGYLFTIGKFARSESGNFGIYRIEAKKMNNSYYIDWAFVMGRESYAIMYCKEDATFGYSISDGLLPTFKAMTDTEGRLSGRVEQSAIDTMIENIPNGSIPLHFVHSHLVDRIDVFNGSTTRKVTWSSVGKHLGLSPADEQFWPDFKGKIGISAIEDNGKSHSIRKGSGGSKKWEDL